MRDVDWKQLHEIRTEPKERRIRSVPPLEFAGMVFASRSFFGTEKPGDELHEPVKAGAGLIRGEGTMIRPQPIREIAPPAWPLPLIASEPKGPRSGA